MQFDVIPQDILRKIWIFQLRKGCLVKSEIFFIEINRNFKFHTSILKISNLFVIHKFANFKYKQIHKYTVVIQLYDLLIHIFISLLYLLFVVQTEEN